MVEEKEEDNHSWQMCRTTSSCTHGNIPHDNILLHSRTHPIVDRDASPDPFSPLRQVNPPTAPPRFSQEFRSTQVT